jgi:hypothetical protein
MADLYVSMSGSDSNKGSLSKPFATIQAAADNAKPGDTVHVLAGTYAGGIASRVNKVTYQAEGKVYIIGGTTASDGDVWSQYGNNVTIKGFNISGLQSPNAFDLLAEYGSYETVKDCVLHDLQTTGLLDYGGAFVADSYYGGHDGIISGCRVYNVGPPGTTSNLVQGIYIGTRNWTVTNDLAYNIVGTGITSWHDATNLTITTLSTIAIRASRSAPERVTNQITP